jgi:hypothetical protein
MKYVMVTLLLLSPIVLSASVSGRHTDGDMFQAERAVVEFNEAVKLKDVILRGEYLVLHDDSKMAQGEPCLYVFRLRSNEPNKLVVSFHCQRVKRTAVDRFTVVVSRATFGIPDIREIQFAESEYAHAVH